MPVVFLSVGDDSSDGLFGFLDTANYFLNEDSPPQVITTSYGSNENEISTNLALWVDNLTNSIDTFELSNHTHIALCAMHMLNSELVVSL